MTREEAIKTLRANYPDKCYESLRSAVDIAIEALKVEPNSCEYWDSESKFCALRRPQAEPIKHGKWINNILGWHCSVCGGEYDYFANKYNYCPNCGAKMDEVEYER